MKLKFLVFFITITSAFLFSEVLRVGIQADIRSTNPQEAIDSFSLSVMGNVFEPLVNFDENGTNIIPWLASSFRSEDGYKKWIYTLREKIKFHDGTPLTAQAVVKSLSNIKNLPFKVEALGDMQVQITLDSPNANFNQILAEPYYFIISPKMIEDKKMVSGTGPFIFFSWEKGKKIVLKRNPNYWQKPAKLEEAQFIVLGNHGRIIQAMVNKEIDLAEWVSGENLMDLKKLSYLTVESIMGNSTGFLSINTTKPPFDNPKVRRAIAAAISPVELTKKYFKGTAGAPASSMVPPALFSYFSKAPKNNPELSKQLLKEANFKNSREFILLESWAPRPYMPDPHNIALDIQKSLEAVGIKVKVEKDPENYFKRMEKGEFDLILNGWIADSGDPVEYIEANLHSRAIGHNNASFWSNPKFDRLLDECKILTGKELEKKLKEVLTIVDEEVPLVPLFHGPQTALVSKKIKGYIVHPFTQLWIYPVEFVE
ncbi:MAG: ABC transporter substrate-binding protein [Thermoanaerobaculia bacterium]